MTANCIHTRKAIIEGIITSAKMPLKKIPKIQKQKQPLSISTYTLDHATPSPLHSSEDMKDLSEDVQSNSSTIILEQTESQQQMETANNSEATCELPVKCIGGESTDSQGPYLGKLEEKGVVLEVNEPERLEKDHQTENKNHSKAPSADIEDLAENEHHLKAPSGDLKDLSTVEESMTVIEAEDHVKATSSESVLPCDAVESTECPQEEVHEVCNIEKSDQKLENIEKDIPMSSTDAKTNTTESRSCESLDKVSALSFSKVDSVISNIGNKIENTSTLKKATKKRSIKMEKDLLNVMNQFLPQPERNVKENLDMNKQSMEQELDIRIHEDIVEDSQEGRFMMNDLVDLETGRDFHQTNEVSSTLFSLTSQLSNDKKLLNSVESSSISSHFDKPSDHQTCENKDFISKAQEDKLDTCEGSKREMDASHPEQGKKHRTVFSEAFHPGLDAGIVHGQWSDDLQMCSEDEFEPDTDRVVQDGPNHLELKITVTNDTPLESKFRWISREQLVKDCIHGKHDNSPYSLKEAIILNSINSVVHKTLPEKKGRVRSISTTEPTHNGDTEATDNGNNSDDEFVYRFEEESFQLEKSPRLCEDEEATVVNNTEKKGQKPGKDSEKIRAALPEVEKIINLVRSQFEDGNDDTTVSSLSSSQTSFRSLSSSQNSQDKFEKVLSDQLNSISQGLDMLMNFDSNSLSFITPDEGKQLNHVIENTMKMLKASMQSQNADPGKTDSEINNTFTASKIRDQEKTEETADLRNAENTKESQSVESNENSSKESVQEKKTDGPHDETAFWSKILGFSMQECKTLPSFFSTPPKTEKKVDEDSCKEDSDVTVMSEISESNKRNTENTCQVSGMDNVIVISDSPKSKDFVQSPLSGSSEKNKKSEVSQSSKMDTDLTQEVDDVIVISDSPISTNEIIKSPTPVNSEKSPEVNNEISSNFEEESKLDGSTVTTESSQEGSKDQKIHISPIRFPDSTFGKEIRKEKMTVTEEVLDDNNNTEVLNNTEEKDKNMIPKIQIEFIDKERKKSEQKEVRSGSKEDSSKNLLLNVGASDLRDQVKSKTPPLEVSVPAKKISPQEKTLTVIIPETKRKVIAQRQSPTLIVKTETKKSENSPRRSPNILSEKDQLASGSETFPARLPTSQQSRRGSVFSRLSPLINEGEEVRKERSESPISEVRTIQLGPSLSSTSTKNEQSNKEKGDGENKMTKSKKDDLVLITINNEKSEQKSKKSRSRSRSSGAKKLSEYKPPPTSANAEPLSTQAGPIRNTGKSKREERQYHPYRKEPPKKKNTWSFDIAYDSLRELMHDLTVSSYKSQHHRPKHCRTNSRFANYTFVRSSVPETLPGGNPDEEEIDEEFNENAIPDFEERKRKADLVDELTLGEQEEDDYTTERQVYSMEDSEQPEQENITKTEEPDRKILPRMLFNLPSRNATISSPSESDKDIKTEEKKFKTEPVKTDVESSEASRTVVKSERIIEIYRKTGPTKKENPSSYSGTLDLDTRENGKKENTEQVSNNDLPVDSIKAEVKTQAMETVKYQSEKTTVHFVNPSSEGVGDDWDLELDECSDWIVLDDASDDISNTDTSTLRFDKEASPSNVNQKSNSESHSSVDQCSFGIPDVDMEEEIHDIFSFQGSSAVKLRPNAADICKSVSDGERDILECNENTTSSITTDSEAKMEEANDICMEDAEFTSRSGNIVESHNEIKDSNSSLDKTVLEVQDMSVSEEEGAAKQNEEESGDPFVPVIYVKGVSGGNFWHRNKSHKVEGDCLVEELDQDQESGSIDNKIDSNMDSNSSVVRPKSPDDLEKVDKEKPKVSKSAEISLLEKEFASYIGRSSSKVEYNSPVNNLKTSDDLKVELDEDKPIGFKSGEISLAEKEFACYIGRGLSYEETKILTASPETSSIIGTTSFEQPLANLSSPSLHIQEAVQDTHNLKEAESQCDYQNPVESEYNSEKETEGSDKVALKLENEINSNENEQTNANNSSQEVRQNEQGDEGKDLIEAAVNCETNGGESKRGTESDKEDNEETTSDNSHKPKDSANSFPEAANNSKGTFVGVNDFKETLDAPKESCEIEAINQHPTDLEKHLDLAVKSIENDLSLCCSSVNATSTPNKKSFNSAQSVHVNISDSLDDKIDDSVWMCNTEKGEELSNTEKGEGLGLLMKNYDQYSGSESFNSSAELSNNQNVLGINADNVEDSLKETCQGRDFTCDLEMSSVTKNAEKINQNADIELKEGKAEEGDEIENPREADSSFDTEQRLEDIMSVIGESQPEIYPEGSVRHSSQIKVLTISSSECDLCDDQLCLAKVKCLTGLLDPLEEAMLSSGILDINDVPMGNEIEIDSDDPVNILHINSKDKVLDEEKETTISDSSEFLANSESSSDKQTNCSNVYTAALCYTTDKLTGESDCGSPRCLDSEVEDEGDTSSTETDYISDSVDSETEAATRGDDWSKLIVSEYLHTKQSNKGIDTLCNLPQTKSVQFLHSNHSQKNQESSRLKEVAVNCSKPSKPLSKSINRQVKSKQEPASQSVCKKNQSIVRPLVPNSRGLSTALAMESTASNSMCSAPLLRQLMIQNSSLSGPRFSMMPPHQISLNPLMLFYTQSQFPSYSNAARTLTPLPLFFPYATNYPTGPQVNPLLSMQMFSPLSPSPAFELTTDKFEAFRRMNNGSEPHFQSSLLGTVPLYGSINPPQSPLHCSSVPSTSPCRTGSFYLNRQITQERSTKITECLRSSSTYSTTDGSPLLPPISSFTQRKVSNMNGAESAFFSCKSPPAPQNIVNQQSSHALYNKEISTQIYSGNSFQKALPEPAALSPLDMTVSAQSNTGSSQKQAAACSRNLFENLNQNPESLQQTSRDKRTPGKIPVGHVRPMSFSSFRDFHKD